MVWPGSGAWATGESPIESGCSKRSPSRTTSSLTVTFSLSVRPPLSAGAAASASSCAPAGSEKTSQAESTRVRSRKAKRIITASPDRGDRAHHRIRGLDDLRIDFIGALGGDEIGHLADHVDVRLLQEELLQLAEADIAGIADGGGAGSLG